MRILMGDDHPIFRDGLQRILGQLFPDAVYAHADSFDELLDLCQDEQPADLILSDLHMPGWPGFEGIAALRATRPKTPVVIVSATEEHAAIRQALASGAAGFIPKASSVPVMLGAIELVLAGGTYLPPSMIRFDEELPALPRQRPTASAAQPPRRSSADQLTHRQREVLDGLCAGKSNKQIAYELGLSEGTVKIHVTAIFRSLGVKNRTQAVISASQLGPRS